MYFSNHKIIMLGSLYILFSFTLCEVLRNDQDCRVICLVSLRKFFFQCKLPLAHLLFPAIECFMVLLIIWHFCYYSYHLGPKFLIFTCEVLIGSDYLLNRSIELSFLKAQNKQVNLGELRFHTSCHVKNLLIVARGIRQSRYIYKVY